MAISQESLLVKTAGSLARCFWLFFVRCEIDLLVLNVGCCTMGDEQIHGHSDTGWTSLGLLGSHACEDRMPIIWKRSMKHFLIAVSSARAQRRIQPAWTMWQDHWPQSYLYLSTQGKGIAWPQDRQSVWSRVLLLCADHTEYLQMFWGICSIVVDSKYLGQLRMLQNTCCHLLARAVWRSFTK